MSQSTTEPTNKTYYFRTFADVFRQLPLEKLRDCMAELTMQMLQAKAADERMCAELKAKGVELNETYYKYPETVGWVDDGKCIIQSNFKGQGGVRQVGLDGEIEVLTWDEVEEDRAANPDRPYIET